MGFGITGKAEGKSFEAPLTSAVNTIKALKANSISVIRIYAHGAPGMIGPFDAQSLMRLLKPKMQSGGQIHLLGCSTAGIEAHAWNPVGGLGLLARVAMYAPMGGDWTANLARDLSVRIPNVYVLGLSGISFPLSRLLMSAEGHKPRGLMADRFVYYNGGQSRLPG